MSISDNAFDDVSTGESSLATSRGLNQGLEAKEAEERWKSTARRVGKAVLLFRTLVGIVLLIATFLVAKTIHRTVRNDQRDDFHHAFEAHADGLVQTFHRSVERKLQAMDTLSTIFTSYALSNNLAFPFVTLPDFEQRASNIRVLAETPLLNICMLVEEKDRLQWEAYIRGQREESYTESTIGDYEMREFQDSNFGYTTPEPLDSPAETPFRDRIMNLQVPSGTTIDAPEGSGPYLPVWQNSPAVPIRATYNFNLFSHPATTLAYRDAIQKGKITLAFADNYEDPSYGATTSYFQLVYSHGQYRHQIGDDYQGGPSTSFAYPIFDSFDLANRKAVALVSGTIGWLLHFSNALPPNAVGIICVLRNSFNQIMTFRVDGPDTVYLGPGDLHDAKYDTLEVKANLNEYIQGIASPQTRAYTTADLNAEFSQYFLSVYPSKDTEDLYVDSEAKTISIVIVLVFVFTTCVFLGYDFLVARRQRFVMSQAVASSAIVSSLFPEQVRDILYEETKTPGFEAAPSESSTDPQNANSAMARFLQSKSKTAKASNKPIASLFDNTTVMFADLVGFTSWSSTRTPEQVFELLEPLYQAFDAAAIRLNVFKVETIGDCYMAATGLPEPQKQHAVIMAKFAERCLQKAKFIFHDLVDTLGEETANLDLRVGLHSGSVTGGVLRGQKSRFQLFGTYRSSNPDGSSSISHDIGDAVNTASRMETTGAPGRIHASKSTADELKRQHKEDWIVKREDEIFAKGKGSMETWWVEVKTSAANLTPTEAAGFESCHI